MLTFTVSADAAGQRLDKYLRRALHDVPLSHVYKLLRTRKVRVNAARGRAEQLLTEGDAVVVRGTEEKLLGAAAAAPAGATPGSGRSAMIDGAAGRGAAGHGAAGHAADSRGAAGGAAGQGGRRRPAPGEVPVTFTVLHEDAHLLAVNKPAGLAAHPGTGITGATLVEEARAYLKVPADLPSTEFKPSPAHRLDRETSGVLLVAKTRKCMVGLTAIFTSGGEVRKSYLALAKGKMPRAEGTVDLALSEHEQTSRSKDARGVNFQEAVTHYRVVSSSKEATLLQLRIETGRTHQIRRHLQAIGHPVAGDARYGDFPWNRQVRVRWGLRRMFLHAWKLALPHPVTGRPLKLVAPIPPELLEALHGANLAPPPGI